jgi:hypothetical protein
MRERSQMSIYQVDIQRGVRDWRIADNGVNASSAKAAIAAVRKAWGYGKREGKFRAKALNPRQPHKRVRKALKKYVGQQLGLPTQYTNAKVRVDSKGEIDIKFARPPKGPMKNPRRFSVKRKK